MAGPATIEAVTVDLCCSRFCRSGFAAFSPDDSPVKRPIEIAELPDGVEPIAGHGQRFGGAPEQLCGNRLAVDLEREFSVDRIGIVAVKPQIRQPSPDGVTSA